MDNKVIWYFENFSLTRILPLTERVKLSRSTKMTEVPKGQLVYFPNDSSNSVYLIKKGKVKISRISEDGREIIIAILGRGEIFGESSISNPDYTREEFAEATDNVVLCSMISNVLRDLMHNNPTFAVRIMKIIGLRLKTITNRLEAIVFKPSDQRVKLFLKTLADQEGQQKNDNEIEIQLNLTHEDIGKLTATSRQMVTTVLNDLEKKNIISFDRKRILIKNLAGIN